MELLRVHIAELVIADDPATADVATAEAVTDRVTAAGHAVVAREIVKDDEAAIRAQLAKWVADPEIDVVIATGPRESKAAHGALAPLVTRPVPGFTDLFRWLAFQEIGASAMQSTAEAAQCGTTFVFVLPASAKGVRETMDKIINPQLDPKTTPRNLVTEMPRLKALVDAAEAVALAKLDVEQQATSIPNQVEASKTEAVPTAIGPEKTEAGIGGQLRLPARRSPTGQNVLRKEPPPDVTRQVDRAQLERDLERAKGTEHDSPTKPSIDLRKLIPRVPPGADDVVDADELAVGDDTDITAIAPPQPLARVKLVSQTPPGGTPAGQPAGTRKPPTIQIPALPGRPATDEVTDELVPVRTETIVTKAAPPPSTRPDTEPSSPPAMAKAAAKPSAKPKPTERGPRPTPPALTPPAGVTATPKPRRSEPRDLEVVSIADLAAKVQREDRTGDEASTVVSKKPVDDSADSAATTARKNRGHAEAPTTRHDPDEAVTKIARAPERKSGQVAAAGAEEAPTTARKDRGGAGEAVTTARNANDAVVADDESPTHKARAIRPPTNPPPTPVARGKRPPTQPPPPPKSHARPQQVRPETEELNYDDVVGDASAIVAVATGATDVATARAKARRPTEPPPPREANDDLPRGKFVYPVHRSATKRILVFGLLAILAAGGGIAFVKFFLMDKPQEVATTPRAADAAVVVAVPIDAAQVAIAEPDAAIPEIVIDVSVDAGTAAGSNTGRPNTGHTNPNTGHTNPNAGHTNPNTGHTPPVDAGVAAVKPDAAVVATPIPPSDPTCDEVSCVLEKYARPCCARYKPADTGFKPVAGVPDDLDKSMVKTGVETVKPRVIACGEKSPAKGTVKVSLTVGPDGIVKDASVVESPAPDLGTCVATALRAARFAKTKQGGSFTYPFVF